MRTALACLAILGLAGCGEEPPLREFTGGGGRASFDHSALDALLRKHVDEEGDVAYAAWKASAGDLAALDAYLASARQAGPSRLSAREAEAFWINVYNALTIRGILEFYPVKSIKDKVSRLGGYNIWDDYTIAIEGTELSLNDIEHRILRPRGDPRVHFALVCAAKSCPRLLNRAYSGAGLDAELDANARHFFRQPKHYRLDRARKRVRLSSILDWYGEDFGKSRAERLAWYARYVPEEDREALLAGDLDVDFIDYDWSLNEQRRRT